MPTDYAIQLIKGVENITDLSPDDAQRRNSWDEFFATQKFKHLTHSRAVYLDIDKLKDFEKITLEFKMPRDVARKLDSKLEVLMVGHIISPYFEKFEKTPLDPEDDDMERQLHLKFGMDGAWLINAESGEVLSKKFGICRIITKECSK